MLVCKRSHFDCDLRDRLPFELSVPVSLWRDFIIRKRGRTQTQRGSFPCPRGYLSLMKLTTEDNYVNSC